MAVPRGVDPEVEAFHKEMSKTLILPAMGLYTIGFYLATIRLERSAIIATVAGICLGGVNAWVTSLAERNRLSAQSHRVDRIDLARWLTSLVCDVPIFAELVPNVSVLVLTWTMLLITAQADMFRKSFRRLIIGAGFTLATGQVFYLFPEVPLRERGLAVFSIVAVTLLFGRMQGYWTAELMRRKLVEGLEAEARLRSLSMERDADLGQQTRTIAHELANLITIVDFATSMPDKVDFQRLRRSLDFIKRINTIVLQDLSHHCLNRNYPVAEIASDLGLLVKKDLLSRGVNLLTFISDGARDLAVDERAGSVFLILRNVIKNGAEAAAKHAGARASVSVTLELDAGNLMIRVGDNGAGMTDEACQRLLAGNQASTKADGHGLGFRFVLEECERNGYHLEVTSVLERGTEVRLVVPAAKVSGGVPADAGGPKVA